MSFKPKTIFKFSDGQNVEFSTLPENFDNNYVTNIENAKKSNGTIHLGHQGNEIEKNAKSLISIEIIF